jgi:hypothetical protein
MNNNRRIDQLEDVLAQFLQPIRNIPFDLVVRSMTGHRVFDFDQDDPMDQALLQALVRAATSVAQSVAARPIERPRPNEVGNDLEPHVMAAVANVGLEAERPRSLEGRGQGVGYPDILLKQGQDRPTYLEIKSYAEGSALTTMRSFYLSPSENPKICCDARHLLLGFGMTATPINGSRNSIYSVTSYKVVNLFSLKCDVKYEFNSDNRRLYDAELILASGRLA